MSTYLAMEVRLVWMSFVLGCILMASYDLLRWFRFFVPHGLVWTGIEDFFYWICAAVMTFLLLFYENSGIVRAYVIACVFYYGQRSKSEDLLNRYYYLNSFAQKLPPLFVPPPAEYTRLSVLPSISISPFSRLSLFTWRSIDGVTDIIPSRQSLHATYKTEIHQTFGRTINVRGAFDFDKKTG